MRERRKAETVLPPPMQLMLSDKEVAAMLGIGVSTVWKKTNDPDGNFPRPFNITERARRWRKSDIIDWVKGLNHDKAAQPA
jgi:predicted DNA-binding transcriptional regulator AlpA